MRLITQKAGAQSGPAAETTAPRSFAPGLRFGYICVLALLTGCASVSPSSVAPPARAFAYPADTFAFANETVFAYRDGAPVEDERSPGVRYSRRCFVMAAGAVQFWKFARFEPTTAPVSDRELARRIRQVVGRGTWLPELPADRRIVIPGYANLREFSAAKGVVLRANLGVAWTTYIQPRRYWMTFGPTRRHQARLNAELQDCLAAGQPVVLWLYNFPRMNINHAVVVYATGGAGGKFSYAAYDPNYTDRALTVTYDPARREFSFEPTFYFPGGPCLARTTFRGVLR